MLFLKGFTLVQKLIDFHPLLNTDEEKRNPLRNSLEGKMVLGFFEMV